jgi:hypothetical protein
MGMKLKLLIDEFNEFEKNLDIGYYYGILPTSVGYCTRA